MLTNYCKFKELFRLDPGIDDILRPVSVSARYAILTDPDRINILTCKEGDMVKVSGRPGEKWNGKYGIVQYIGPISRPKEADKESLTWADRFQGNIPQNSSTQFSYIGTWFGIEIIIVSVTETEYITNIGCRNRYKMLKGM